MAENDEPKAHPTPDADDARKRIKHAEADADRRRARFASALARAEFGKSYFGEKAQQQLREALTRKPDAAKKARKPGKPAR